MVILNLHKPPYEIGARRIGCNDGDGKWCPDQVFVLVREVTQGDWIAFCRSVCGPQWPEQWQIDATTNDRFFEVATD